MNGKCYDCVNCMVNNKLHQSCRVLEDGYAKQVNDKHPCNFFKTTQEDKEIKKRCAERLVAIGRIRTEKEYLDYNVALVAPFGTEATY